MGYKHFYISIEEENLKILFAAPFVLETKTDAPLFPMHFTTQGFIDALRYEGFEVNVISTESQFESEYSNSDLVIVMADGKWLCQTIDAVKPELQILYYYIISRPLSPHVIPCSLDTLLPSQMIEQITHLMKSK